MLPLSTSSREAVWSRRFSRLERRMENTEAASVEAMTAPSRKLSKVGRDRTAQQNSPTSPAVRLGLAPVGAEAAVEHDEDEGKGADVLGQTVVVKGNLDHPVRAEEHAQQNEGQQGGHPQLAGELVAQHAGQDDKGGEKQQMGHKQSFQYRAWEGKTYHITILVSLSYQDNAAMTSPDRGPVKREKKQRLPKNSCFLQATPL